MAITCAMRTMRWISERFERAVADLDLLDAACQRALAMLENDVQSRS